MSKSPTGAERVSKSRSRRKTYDALEVIDRTILNDNPGLRELAHEATVNALVASAIYEARKDAGLTQTELAAMIGTKQPVISQLENADYDGHSLTMLKRIADALGKRLEIRFVDDSPSNAVA